MSKLSTNEIIEALRKGHEDGLPLMGKAADEIELLRDDVLRLKEKLWEYEK